MRTLLTTLHSKYIHPSLALPCLAAYCGEACGEILIREHTIHQPKENLLAQILAIRPDVVAFSVYVWNRQLTLELATALKVARPELRLVLGGPEVSFENADFFCSCPVDALICGEGEIPLRHLLHAWNAGLPLTAIAGLQLPGQSATQAGQSQLENLDELPSPFAAGLVDLQRGYVYYESSRGCPYSCSFCMSALDARVRSFSMARIKADLTLLMAAGGVQIKFVDRTFNYHGARSREIIRFILEHNRCSHFHFEIGGDLLDEETLALLETVPAGMFQFEIGVQTTQPDTLKAISRTTTMEKLAKNIRRLRSSDKIHLHLDLIVGLPGEGAEDIDTSLKDVFALEPHHLQVELVKLLPGAFLRCQAAARGIRYDPAPPYSVLATPLLSFALLEKYRGIGRLIDLIHNSGRFPHFLAAIAKIHSSPVEFYQALYPWWLELGGFNEPLGLRSQFDVLANFFEHAPGVREALARDYALAGRVVPGKAPDFFDCELSPVEKLQVKQQLKQALAKQARGEKLQHFACIFYTLRPGFRTLALYFYHSRSGTSPIIREMLMSEDAPSSSGPVMIRAKALQSTRG